LGFQAGINFYAYVNNNPVNFNDPSGHVQNWPSLLRQGVGIIGNGVGIGGGIVTFGAGVGLVATPEPTMLSVAGGIGLIGLGTTTFATSVNDLNANIHAFMNNVLETNVPRSMGLRADVLQTLGFKENDSVAGGVFDAVSLASGIPTGRIAGNILDIPFSISTIDNVNTALGAGDSIFNSTSSIMESLDLNLTGLSTLGTPATLLGGMIGQGFSGASGGFVLYPSKPNTNMMRQIYTK